MDRARIVVEPGDWVILENDIAVFAHKDLAIVIERAEEMDGDDVTISKQPSSYPCFY